MDQRLGQPGLRYQRIGSKARDKPSISRNGLGRLVLGIEGTGHSVGRSATQQTVGVGLIKSLKSLLSLGILAVFEQFGGGQEF